MHDLQINTAELKTAGDHRYYIFPAPVTHKNQKDRPSAYADESKLKTYAGRGSNGSARLLPDVLNPANLFMAALLDYGAEIDDWSLKSAIIGSGYRPDDANQGSTYLRIIKDTIANNPKIFGTATFPSNLEADAQGVLGKPGDARRVAFKNNVAAATGWSADLANRLFQIVDNAYAPRGSNPHATGFVFDLDFSIYHCGWEKKGGKRACVDGETKLGFHTSLNAEALKSAAGVWINTYSMEFGFDSYDTGAEVWHMEYRL